MTTVIGLAGDTMLGREVAAAIERGHFPFADEVVQAAHEADLLLLNLECCLSARGRRWPDRFKPFFFRAPPAAVEVLRALRVGAVNLANNHALDFGFEALQDTLSLLDAAGIARVGAGMDEQEARRPAVVRAGGLRVALCGFTDHPRAFAAGPDRPGVAWVDPERPLPPWVGAAVRAGADLAVATPHWGPNMVDVPVRASRRMAESLVAEGMDLVAGHSAHVFQGVWRGHGPKGRVPVLFDLGDFVDDYARDPVLRNDLGLLWLVHLQGRRPVRLEAVPLKLDFCFTRLAEGEDRAWIRRRLQRACEALGTRVVEAGHRLVMPLEDRPPSAVGALDLR